MTASMLEAVAAFCEQENLLTGGESVVVGVSGGPDSLCLLHVLHTLAPRLKLTLTVAHLNHQLRGDEAQADAEFVQAVARRWHIPAVVKSQNVASLAARRKQSIEETARQVRYAFLWQAAQTSGSTKIAVGHNADDQAETVLMHFLRGSGLLGLRGMQPAVNIGRLRLHPDDRPAAAGSPPRLIRPLLETSRTQIEAYCRENDLSPRLDRTNLDTTYFRNRLRHELFPVLESFNPNIRETLRRTARVVAAEIRLMDQQRHRVWPTVVQTESTGHVTFDTQSWRNLPLALKRSTLRHAIERLRRELRDIRFDHIERAIELVETGQRGAQASLPQGLQLTVGYRSFTLAGPAWRPRSDIPQISAAVTLNLPGETQLPGSPWKVMASIEAADTTSPQAIRPASGWEACLDADSVGQPLILRPRQPGDKFCPLGMAGRHKKINEFMIDEKIPTRWRNRLPLLVGQGRILWVCGYRPDERARINSSTTRVLYLKFTQIE